MLNHRIHNHQKLLSEIVADNFEKLIEELSSNLKKLFKRYTKLSTLEIILSEDGGQYNVTLEINLKSGPLIVKRSDTDLDKITRDAFKTLKREVISALQKERRDHLRARKANHSRQIVEIEKHLDESYRSSDKLTFEQLFKAGIPGLRSYIERKLFQVNQTGSSDDTFKTDNVINDLFLRVYDQFDDHPRKDEELLAWVYKQADELIEQKLKERDVPETISNGGATSSVRTSDNSEEYELIDEFDSALYLHNMYDLEDIFADNPEEAERMEELLDLAINREEFHQKILGELSTQPMFNRAVFDLYSLEKFDETEIAEMKKTTEKEVQDALRNTRTYLKERIRSWAKSPEAAV